MRRDSARARDAESARVSDAARQAEMTRGYEAGVSAGQAQLQSQNDALAARIARLDEILNRAVHAT